MTSKITRLLIQLLFIYLPYSSISGQDPEILIRGRIVDMQTERPLELASVVVRDTLAQFITGTTSDGQGQFKLELPPGVFHLAYSFVGYQTFEQRMTIRAKNSRQLLIELLPYTNQLEQINVIGEKSRVEYQIDRKVIHVGKDLQAIGGGSDLLDQLAEVQVSPDGQLSMRGSDQVQLLLNGKPSALSNADLLQQISSADVLRIELITTPGAQYRADGLSGMINIVTRQKTRRGFQVNVNSYASSNDQYQANLHLTYGTPVWGIQARTGWSDRSTSSRRRRSRYSLSNRYEESAVRTFDGGVKSLDLGVDYLPGGPHQLSAQFQRFDNRHDILSRADINEQYDSSPNAYTFLVDNAHNHQSMEANLNYRYSWVDNEQFLEIEWHRSKYVNDLDADYRAPGLSSSQSLDYRNRIDNIAIDITHPFHKWKGKWEGGVLTTHKYSVNTPNGNLPGTENTFRPFQYLENTWAGYSLLSKKWDQWSLQAGLRYEYYRAKAQAESTTQNLFSNFFPSFHINFAPADNRRFQLAYNRRTSRPSLWHLNPYSNPDNRYFQHRGNPKLQPEFSHNLELGAQLSYDQWRIYPTLFTRYKTDLINQVYELEEDRTIETFINDGRSLVLGLEVSTVWQAFPFWEITLSGNAYREQLHVESPLGGSDRLYGGNIRWRHQIRLGKRYHFDIAWNYYAPGRRRFGQYEARQKADVAVRWQFWKERAQLGFRLTDVLNTFEFQNNLSGAAFRETYFYKGETRVAYLNFSYRLAKGANGPKRQRKKRDFYEAGTLE